VLTPDKLAVPKSDFVRVPLPAKIAETVTVLVDAGFNM